MMTKEELGKEIFKRVMDILKEMPNPQFNTATVKLGGVLGFSSIDLRLSKGQSLSITLYDPLHEEVSA